MHKDRETSFYTQEILYPEPGFPIRFYYDRSSIEHALKYNLVGLECERQLWQHNRWSRFRPIHRSRILTLEVLLPSSCRTSFSSFSRCTGSSVKVTVALDGTNGWRQCRVFASVRCCRGERRNSKLASKTRGRGPREGSWKKNTTNTRRRILHTAGWIVFPWGEKERVRVNGARYLRAGIDSLRESFRWCTVTAS